jgi:hypothetical protein
VTPPVFIVGNDRSGTTMLRLVLDRGPEIAIPPESMYLTDLSLSGVPLDGGDRAAAQAVLDELWQHPKVRLWQLPGGPPTVPAGLDAADTRRFVLAAPFAAYAAARGKARWGDKTPHYVHHVGELLEIWPDARVVVLVRDGRDVALSVRRMPFGPNNAWAAAQWWARGIRAGQAAQAAHPDNVRTVRYEDLVAEPERHIAGICAFGGLRFTPEMLDLRSADRAAIVPDQRSWFPGLFDGIRTDAAERWRREMPVRDQAVFAALARDELEALGYPVPSRPVAPPGPARVRLYHRHNELMRNVNFVRLRVFQERGRELGVALQRRLRDPIRRAEAQRGRR